MRFPFTGFNDTKLIESIQGGAEHQHYEEAMIQLYEKFTPKAMGYLLKNHQVSQDEAEEIASAALLSLIEKIQGGLEVKQSLLNYFIGIVSNLVINWSKRHRLSEVPPDYEGENELPDIVLIEKENWETAERILNQLPPHCRKVLLEVREKEEYTNVLAERLGYANANALYVTRSKCKRDLKKILQKEGYN